MIVQYASDLHLDYGQNYEYVLNKGFEEEGNVLILAGDVANLVALRTYRLFWDLCSSNFEKTIFVPGNHDYYGEWDKVEDLIEPIKISIRPNVTCCNNEVVRVGDTDFICSTLWSNIIPEQAAAVNSTLLDFSEITFDGKRITSGSRSRVRCQAYRRRNAPRAELYALPRRSQEFAHCFRFCH